MSRLIPLLFLTAVSLAAQPAPVHGVLTLGTSSGVVPLDGQWTFVPRAEAGEGVDLAVPGSWDAVLGGPDGWGTYRLIVKTDVAPQDLALYLPIIHSAAAVRWNGVEVWRSGNPDEGPNFVPDRRTAVVPLPARAGDNLLEIQVASRGDMAGGLTESLKLGPWTALWSDRSSAVLLSVLLFGCLFVIGVYHLGLFAHRPSDRSPLWFALAVILLSVRDLALGPVYLADLFPWLSWEALLKLAYITFTGTAVFFVLFIRDLFPRTAPRWLAPAVIATEGVYSFWVLVAPAAWYTPGLLAAQLAAGVGGILSIVVLVRALLKRERGAGLFLGGFLVFFLTILYDILKTNYFFPGPFLASWGLLAFVGFQSLVVLRQITAAFAESERAARRLASLNLSLERFIPREMLSYLNKRSILDVELGDHTEHPMSVMFVTVRDFAEVSDAMTASQTFQFINSYLKRLGPVVRANQGFVDKYLGWGIMALFPGDARNALEAALGLMDSLALYNQERVGEGGHRPIRTGVGIHRGPLMLGTIGENLRMDSTVISDTVNAASRLQGLTRKLDRDVLVSGETVEALGMELAARYRLEYLTEETVKGRRRPLKVYSLAVRTLEEDLVEEL